MSAKVKESNLTNTRDIMRITTRDDAIPMKDVPSGTEINVVAYVVETVVKDRGADPTGEEFDCLVQSFDPKAITNYGGIQVGSIEVTPSSPSNVIFAALANISSGGGLLLEANANGSVYTYTIDSFACLPDNYYLCDVKMTKQE